MKRVIHALERHRSRLMTIAVAGVAVVLVGFAVWCVWLMSNVSTLRDDVSTRVGWLQRLHELQADAQVHDVDAELDGLVAEIEQDPRTGLELHKQIAQRERPAIARINAMVPRIRAETAELSAILGDRWTAINWLAGVALVLAASTLGLLVYVHAVLLRRARLRVEDLQTYLNDADRLAAVGTLAAGVAHELSNPLTYVVTNLQLLEEKLSHPATCELATEALQGTKRAMGIVRDLRSIARPSRGEISPCDVESCLDAALNITRREIRAVAQVIRDYEGVPLVAGSEARLGQLFLNLVINATHAMADTPGRNHELRLTTRYLPLRHVEVGIHDTGSGIPEHLRERVLEPFVTSKPLGKGTGLGLFICHNIVASLDGTMELQTGPDGTSVTVRLPVAVMPSSSDPGRTRSGD